jgi:hypothetical protein
MLHISKLAFALFDPLLIRYTHLLKDMEKEEAILRGWEANQVGRMRGPRLHYEI